MTLVALTVWLTSGAVRTGAPAADTALASTGDNVPVASDIFLRLPVNVLDILPRSTRFDMLEYFKVDSIYKASNAMEGLSWLRTVTPDFLEVQITDVSTLQIKVLPAAKGKYLIMTLYTVGGDSQAPDTDIRFFDTELNELPRDKYFKLPQLKDFFDLKGALTSMKEIERMIPFPTVEYTASADSDRLNAKLTVGEFMNQDDYRIIRVLLRPDGLTYLWDGKKYKLSKP